ncbi:MAG: sigma-70 family RNA polymerase sigma factor [Flavobacteriia bacterium]|jgi:DNA-directed RNA polymerase specialized sigma24 family protein|nr:sigma-70 family RNA polymerase sigma factor [Flavobacteriia bacterium]
MIFWERDAYAIARKITGNNPLSFDLVSHVFIILYRYDIPEADIPAMFSRIAWNQWTWSRSEFWKLYRSSFDELIEIAEIETEVIESNYRKLLRDFIETDSMDDQENFKKEITKMHLCGMTFREIQQNTGISLDTIHRAIKQFKNDLFSYSNRNCEGNDDLQVT